MKLQTIANMSQFDNILVRQHSWEVAPMSSIQLVQNAVAATDVLLVALAALQVLRRQRVETLQGDDLPNVVVQSACCQTVDETGRLHARKSQRPHPVRHPQA